MKSTEFLDESINDKGIFKAVFLSGLPGSGKSTIISKITDGATSPRIVNTDKSYEFLMNKNDVEGYDEITWSFFGPKSKTMNSTMLYNYVNGMLPMFVDGTSANTGALLKRSGLLESIGYDTMMIWVNVDLEQAIARAQGRKRQVEPDFIRRLHKQMEANKAFYQSRFGGNFIEVDNNNDNFASMEAKTYGISNKFFTSAVQNPIGIKNMQTLEETGKQYLTPSIYDPAYIKKMISVWYQK